MQWHRLHLRQLNAQYVVSRLSRAQTFATDAMEKNSDRTIVYLAQHAALGLTYDGSLTDAESQT